MTPRMIASMRTARKRGPTPTYCAVRTVGVAAQGVAVYIAAARIVAAFGLGLHTW